MWHINVSVKFFFVFCFFFYIPLPVGTMYTTIIEASNSTSGIYSSELVTHCNYERELSGILVIFHATAQEIASHAYQRNRGVIHQERDNDKSAFFVPYRSLLNSSYFQTNTNIALYYH